MCQEWLFSCLSPSSFSLDNSDNGRSDLEEASDNSFDISVEFDNQPSSSPAIESSVYNSETGEDDAYANTKPVDPQPISRIGMGRPEHKYVACNECGKYCCSRRYHCVECIGSSMDLCLGCVAKGVWCIDLTHQLYRRAKWKPTAVVFHRTHDVSQELRVCRIGDGKQKRVAFQLGRNYRAFLYDSPPVVHPEKPLVVWPLTGDCLLFGDMALNKAFEQRIRMTNERKGEDR